MASDNFLNWPYPRLLLLPRLLPADNYRSDKDVMVNGEKWAGARRFEQIAGEGKKLAELTRIKNFERIRTWVASIEAFVPLQVAVGLGIDNTARMRPYYSVFAHIDEVTKILADLYGYCPFSLEGLIRLGDLRASVSGLDKAAIVEQAYGLKARQWFDQVNARPVPAVSYLSGSLWPGVEYSEVYVPLDEVLFVLSTYYLINHGKLDIKLPPKRVRLFINNDTVECAYTDETDKVYTAPVPNYTSTKHREATEALLRTTKKLQNHHKLRVEMGGMLNVPARAAGQMDAELSGIVERFFNVFTKEFDNAGVKQKLDDVFSIMAADMQLGGKSGAEAVSNFNAAIGAELFDEAVKTRQAFLDAYLTVAEERGKHPEQRIKQVKELNKARAAHIQVAEVFDQYRDSFTRMYSNESLMYLPKHLQPMPAGVGSQWRIRYNTRGEPVQALANEQLPLLVDDLDFSSLKGHQATIDLIGAQSDKLLGSVNQVFMPRAGSRATPPAIWIMPKVFSAVMYFYYHEGGLDSKNGIRLYANDILDFMNVGIDKNLRQRAFGTNYNAFDLLESALVVFEHLKYQRDDNDGSKYHNVNGMLKIWEDGVDKLGRRWYDIALSPDVQSAMVGRSKDMGYMYHNFEAMRSYRQNQLQLNPAAQMALETLASIRIRKHGTQELLTQNNEPWTIESLNKHLGIQKGAESWPKYIAKFMGVLDTQANYGTLKDFRIEGKEYTGQDFGKTRIVPVFGDALYAANMQSRAEREVMAAHKALTDPVVKKGQGGKRTYPTEAVARPRGRPRKPD